MFVHPQFKNFSLKPFLRGFSEIELRNKLAKFFPSRYVVFTDSGRSAFRVAIEELGLKNSEMLVPAYLCDIFLPIFEHCHIRPIYLDIDLKNFNIQISEIEKRITPETKSILVSHTYGFPNDMDKISEIARKHNLKIIEDCAHSFGIKNQNKYLGNSGDAAFFSLSKFIPSINGGFLVSGNPIDINLAEYKFRLTNLIKFSRLFPCLAKFSEKFRKEEKTLAVKDYSEPRKVSKISLKIFNWYLDNFEEQVQKRIKLVQYFQEKLIKIGFQTSPGIAYISALVPQNINRDELFNKLGKQNIFCSRIWHNPIHPNLPNAAEAAKRIINLPLQNWFTGKDIDKIIAGILSKKD
jgi:dTDP-4-amino-4,6-dideoxygalactose transaminase